MTALQQAQQAALAQFCEREQVPGVAVAVLGRHPRLLVHGVADLNSGRPVQENTRFVLASVTKSFTGLLFSELERDGKVQASDQVSSVVPEADLHPETTFAHLLSHFSGLGRAGLLDPQCGARFASRAAYLASLPGTPLQSLPGEWYSYSNEGFALLGITIERLTGKPLEQVYEALFAELGMSDSTPHIDQFQAHPERVYGYDLLGRQLAPATELPLAPASLAGGRLSCSIQDMARYGSLMLERAISAPESLEFGVLNQWAAEYGYARGWMIKSLPAGPLIAHGGSLPGTATYVALLPAEKIGVVVLSNLSGAPARLLAEELLSLERGAPLLRTSTQDELPSRSLTQAAPEALAQLAGTWTGPGGELSISSIPGGLQTELGATGAAEKPTVNVLRPLGEQKFLVTNGPSEGQPAYSRPEDDAFAIGGYLYHRKQG